MIEYNTVKTINETNKQHNNKYTSRELLLTTHRDSFSFPKYTTFGVSAAFTDNKGEISQTVGIPIFTTNFDDNLYFNGRATARYRSIAIATKLKVEQKTKREPTKDNILQVTFPRVPPNHVSPVCRCLINEGAWSTVIKRSQIAKFMMRQFVDVLMVRCLVTT